MTSRILNFLLLFALTSCNVNRLYTPPTVETPTQWKTEISSCRNDFRQQYEYWWEAFEDPTLNDLQRQALENNYSLQAAYSLVEQAYALAQVDRSYYWPQIFFAPSYAKEGSLTQNPITGDRPGLYRFVQSSYRVPFQFSYEVDLWGKYKNLSAASYARFEASQEAYQNVLLQLTANIATSYLKLRTDDRRIELLNKTISMRTDALSINQCRYDSGLIEYIDVVRAKEELALARAELLEVEKRRALEENILAVLVGQPPQTFKIDFNPIRNSTPVIIPVLPSELLCRRPDLAEAERNIAAAHADIGVAYTEFFPSIKLNAELGFESPFRNSLFEWKSRLWDFGIDLVQSVYSGGRNEANYSYACALYQEALAEYQESVLNAFKDVEDALINLRESEKQEIELAQATEASKDIWHLTYAQYDCGYTSYYDVVDAERDLLANQLLTIDALEARFLSTVLLVRALGGGW